jgi:hypothetical protein
MRPFSEILSANKKSQLKTLRAQTLKQMSWHDDCSSDHCEDHNQGGTSMNPQKSSLVIENRFQKKEKSHLSKSQISPSTWGVLWLAFATLTPSVVYSREALVDALDLIRQSDRSRGGSEKGLTWTAEVESEEDGEKTTRTYSIKAKKSEALVETLTPVKNKGELMLFNEQSLWFYRNGLRKPVTLSKRQKLTGQTANGDIAATDYAANYSATLEGEDLINGEKATRLFLKSKNSTTTYDQIRYWISKDRKVALKAEFLTLQGEIFKTAHFTYGNELQVDGRKIPFVSEMKIVDGNFKENVSLIRYREPKSKELPSSTFNVNQLMN